MSRNLEIEFKNIVTEEEFYLLLEAFHIAKNDFFTQENHYFDTSNYSLKNVGAALRVRELANKREVTLKIPQDQGLLEINDILTEQELEDIELHCSFPNGEVVTELQHMGINLNDLQWIGSLRTDRAEIVYKNGLLVFDHSFYLGKQDFEIEYETANWNEGKKIFHHLLQELNIKQQTTISKIARLYQEKRNGLL